MRRLLPLLLVLLAALGASAPAAAQQYGLTRFASPPLKFINSGDSLEIGPGFIILAGDTLTSLSGLGGGGASAFSELTGSISDGQVPESAVTQHEAAIGITASQVTGGTFAVGRISEASVTQHQAALTVTESQISDLAHFGGAFSDLTGTATAGQIPNLATSKITSGTFANARISASSVTQHEAALTVTESQISDLAHTTDTDDQAATEVLYAAGGTVADTTAALRTDVNAIDAAALGLGNVDNTADADKPVSTATQTALDAKQDTADLEDDVEQTVEVHELQDYDTRVVDKTLYNRVDAGIAFQRTTVSGVTSYEWDPRDEPVLYVNLPGSTFTLNVDDTFEASGFAAELDVRVYFAQPAGGSIEVSWESPDFGFEGEMQILAAGDDDQPDPGASVVTRFDGTFTATTATIMRKSVRQTQ